MPDFPIIDTHVHLWDPAYLRIPWLDEANLLNRRYALPEYQQYTQGVDIEGIVYVEVNAAPQYTLLEAKWAVAQAQQDSRLLGIVAHAPIEFGERIRVYLDSLVNVSPLIKGVRRLVQDEEDSTYSQHPDFIRGIQILAEYKLSCDICVRHWQLASIIKLAHHCPDTVLILDHIGKPDIKSHLFDSWQDNMAALATYPNVVCKISGLATEADLEHWTAEDLAPYVEHVLAVFGEERILFGSDWPVALQATSYPRWVETLDTLTAHLSDAAKHKLWNENARRFYRLERH